MKVRESAREAYKKKDRDMENYALATNPTFLRLIEGSRLSYARHGGIPLDEVASGFGIALPGARKAQELSRRRRVPAD